MTMTLPNSRPARKAPSFRQALWIVPLALLGAVPAPALGQEAYPPPTPPKPIPPEAPNFQGLDAEVDAFVRIPLARQQGDNVTGKGLAVVLIDSGLNNQHICFKGQIVPGRNFSTAGGADDTSDTDGHGSNVGGIIAAKKVDDLRMPLGIAHEAKIVPLKVFPGGSFVKINESLQWVLDNIDPIKTDHGVRISVVNMSLGVPKQNLQTPPAGGEGDPLTTQRNLISQLRAKDVVVTVSAGNSYKLFAPQQGMSFPAICPETTSVGAIFDKAFPPDPLGQPIVRYADGGEVRRTRPGRFTVFSQRLSVGAARTDICAPGFIVTSMGSQSDPNPTISRSTQDGTSQASPVVAGVVLLLQEYYRKLVTKAGVVDELPSVDFVEACLRNGGVAIADFEDDFAAQMDNVISSGGNFVRLDAVRAVINLRDRVSQNLQTAQLNALNAPDLAPASALPKVVLDKVADLDQ